jgi:hypothetical protein
VTPAAAPDLSPLLLLSSLSEHTRQLRRSRAAPCCSPGRPRRRTPRRRRA